MLDILYPWIKAVHLIAVIFWMAGLLYLPRLFVYHSVAQPGGELEAKMEEAEAKLLRIIMNPAMITLFVLGLILLAAYPQPVSIWTKALFALGLIGYHGFLAKTRKQFLQGDSSFQTFRFSCRRSGSRRFWVDNAQVQHTAGTSPSRAFHICTQARSGQS